MFAFFVLRHSRVYQIPGIISKQYRSTLQKDTISLVKKDVGCFSMTQ